MVAFAYGQSDDATEQLQVPVRALASEQSTQMDMTNFSGYYSSGTEIDPLSHYERSRLGRWNVAREVDREDSVVGIELETPAGPIRIRYEVTFAGQPFRAAREQKIDELLAIATEPMVKDAVLESSPDPEPKEVTTDQADDTELPEQAAETEAVESEVAEPKITRPPDYIAANQDDRLAAYARSRGSRLKKRELRRRVADIVGGPALLWVSSDFAADRKETATLFALLDTDEDGVISNRECDVASETLNEQDINRDGRVDWNELRFALKSRSARRRVSPNRFSWRSWDAKQSSHAEDLTVKVSFAKEAGKSNLTVDNCELIEPWSQSTAELKQAYAQAPVGRAVLLSHPKVAIALTAVASAKNVVDKEDQISVGVVMEGNPLHRQLDGDGDGSLSAVERRSCGDLIKSLDRNADGDLAIDELPVLLRVCVAQGACAHEALVTDVSVVPSFGNEDEQDKKLETPEWFVSMDRDGDRTLTRKEFLGDRASFGEMDTDENDLLSVAEVLAGKSE